MLGKLATCVMAILLVKGKRNGKVKYFQKEKSIPISIFN
jgi:hypothetical protein